MGLDDLTQGLPAQLLRGQSRRLTVDALRRPGGEEEKDEWGVMKEEMKELENGEERCRKKVKEG